MERALTFIPHTSTMRFDIMTGGRFYGQIAFLLTPGIEYAYDEVKAMARIKRPSLESMDFELLPTNQRVFSNEQ